MITYRWCFKEILAEGNSHVELNALPYSVLYPPRLLIMRTSAGYFYDNIICDKEELDPPTVFTIRLVNRA